VRAVTGRFAQIDPGVPVAVDGYLYNGRPIVRPVVDELRAIMPGLRATIVIPYRAGEDAATDPDNSVLVWDDLLAQHSGAGSDKNGYLYNGRPIVRPVVDELRAIMPDLRATIVIPYLAGEDAATDPDNSVLVGDDLLAQHSGAELR
jgi:hypothetical protein